MSSSSRPRRRFTPEFKAEAVAMVEASGGQVAKVARGSEESCTLSCAREGALEFRILGPLEVWDGEQLVELTAPKHRALLAALLANANQAVSLDRLVEYLWGEQAPSSARSLVKLYVSQVRRLLLDRITSPSSELQTRTAGYVLTLAPTQLDWWVFERLVSEAETARMIGQPEQAATLLGRALGLWRGEPLADVRSDLLQHADVPPMNARRLAVMEARNELELELGRHAQIISGLEAAVGAHPLRERLRAQLMTALSRTGRRADALAVYQDGRRAMVEQLGIDPDPALQQLEQAILADDPALLRWDAAEPVSSSSPNVRPPSQLPPDISDFTGRGDVCERIRELIAAETVAESGLRPVVISAIAGKAGVGKTAVAVRVAHLLRDRFLDGQLFVNLRGYEAEPLDPSEVLAAFLRALSVDGATVPEGLDERVQLYRTRLAGGRVLVVLDNAASEAQVRPLLPGAGGCAALITSRQPLSGLEAVQSVGLDVFHPEQAIELLGLLAGPERIAAESEAAALICARCGYLPLAIRVAGAKLAAKRHWTLTEFARRLDDERRRLSELVVGDLEVRSSLALSYRGLNGAEQRALRLLGLIDVTDFAAWVLVPLLGLEMDDVTNQQTGQDLIERLVDAQLVEVSGHDAAGQLRYRFHDLVRAFVRERLHDEETPQARAAALRRLLVTCLVVAEQADAGLVPGERQTSYVSTISSRSVMAARAAPAGGVPPAATNNPQGWLEAERVGLVWATEAAFHAGLWTVVCGLARALAGFFDRRAYWDDWQRTHTVALDASRREGTPAEEANVLLRLGTLQHRRWLSDAALDSLEPALRLFLDLNDMAGAAHVLRSLGEVHTDQCRYDEAATCLHEALERFTLLEDSLGQATTLLQMGFLSYVQSSLAVAVEQLQQSLALFMRLEDRWGEGVALDYLGGTLRQVGRYEEAVASLTQSLEVLRELGDRLLVSQVQRVLGLALLDVGRLDEALVHTGESLAIARELGGGRLEGASLYNLGEVLRQQGKLATARTTVERALDILQELDDRLGVAHSYRCLGHIARTEGKLDLALDLFGRCLPTLEELGDGRGQALVHLDLGALHEALNSFQVAAGHYESAARLFREIGHEPGEAQSEEHLIRLTTRGLNR